MKKNFEKNFEWFFWQIVSEFAGSDHNFWTQEETSCLGRPTVLKNKKREVAARQDDAILAHSGIELWVGEKKCHSYLSISQSSKGPNEP